MYTHGRQEVYSDSPLLTLTVGRLLECVVASFFSPSAQVLNIDLPSLSSSLIDPL